MFGWRRRSEGFEWREYVRTTVLVRRADRQRKIDDARMEVIAKVKDTRDRGVEAGRAGVEAASNHVAEASKAGAHAVWRASAAGARLAWRSARQASSAVVQRLPALPVFRRPQFSLPQRSPRAPSQSGSPSQAGRLRPDAGWKLPFRVDPQIIGGGALALAVVVIGGPMLQGGSDVSAPRFTPTISVSSVDKVTIEKASATTADLSGRATAISGDLLRVNGQLVRLAGIEPPAAKHPCLKANGRRWNCSAAARTALEKLVRGKAVACAPSNLDDEGRTLASCTINGDDIADAMVRGGHVFAVPGLFASYGSAEGSARDAKLGLWQGETVRPQQWREQIWEEAKRASPEGCPIKGYTRASDRLYAMPWANGYDGAKVRSVKGDRWFCSEEEARSAGFKSASRS